MRIKREITLFESLMLAILLSLLMFFASDRLFFANFIKKINKIMETASKKKGKEIKFTFVDLPEETPVKSNPKAKLFSDISRKASGGKGKKSNNPFSKGNTKEIVIKKGMLVKSRKMKSMPTPQEIMKQVIKEKGKKKSSEKQNGSAFEKPLSGSESKQKTAQVMKKKPYLNTENLFSATKPEIYNNENGGFTIPGNFSIDTQGFDLGPYAKLIQQKVKSNWIVPPVVKNLFLRGVVKVEFDIKKNGRIENLGFLKKTGIEPLDKAAFLAIKYSDPFPPLPSFIKNDKIHVKWTFYYYYYVKMQ